MDPLKPIASEAASLDKLQMPPSELEASGNLAGSDRDRTSLASTGAQGAGGADQELSVHQSVFPFFEGSLFEPRVDVTPEVSHRLDTPYVGAQARRPHSEVVHEIRSDIQAETDSQATARLAFLGLGAAPNIHPRTVLDESTYKAAVATALGLNGSAATHKPHLLADKKGGERIAYNETIVDPRTQLIQQLSQSGVWNTPFAKDGHLSLSWPELRSIADQVENFLQDRVTLVLPFAKEPDTIALNYLYARRFIDPDCIFATSAGCHPSSEKVLSRWLPEQDNPLSQAEILAAIDWDRVTSLCGLPRLADPDSGQILAPKGTKGLTMFAGMLAAHAKEKLLGRFVAFHDTDIVNPDHYDALRLLAVPFALSNPGLMPSIALIAKSGAGRNNQGWTGSMNLLANDPMVSDAIRMTARQASCLVWPLSGERMAAGDMLYATPWSTGMSIETNLNLMFSSSAVMRGKPQVHQVVAGVRKLESGMVSEEREWNMMQMCRGWGEALLRYCSSQSKTPVELSLKDIREFNREVGGRVLDSLHQSPEDEFNTVTTSAFDFLLPSMAQLEEIGAIDWSRLGR